MLGLVFALIVSGLFEVFLSFIVFKEKPRFHYIPNRAKLIFSNAKGISLSAALSYINENIDDFVLGKVIGTYNLGLYHNAYGLGHKTNYDFAKSIHHSILPVFTKIVDNSQRIKRAFIKSLSFTILFSIGISIPLLVAPEFLVNLILGDKWLIIVPYLYLFVLAGILQSITLIFYSLFFAQKNYRFINYHLAMTVTVLFTLLLILPKQGGIAGAGIALIVSRAITLPIVIYGAFNTLKK